MNSRDDRAGRMKLLLVSIVYLSQLDVKEVCSFTEGELRNILLRIPRHFQ